MRRETEARAARLVALVLLLLFARARYEEGARTEAGMASAQTEHPTTESEAAAISRLAVRTLSEYTGRGPTTARTYLHDDLVTVVLQDTLTKGERSLVADGLTETVMAMRRAFQGTMRNDLVGGIEQILGRTVAAFLSDAHIDPDVAVEVFVLSRDGGEPHGDGAQGVG
jgi:uncharacterized protein YbcI